MKQNPNIIRKCEYIPDNIARKINETADISSGKPKVRHDNYLAIVGTIYFKCLTENNYAFIPYPLASKCWKKVVGDEYAEYVNDLLEAGVIKREKKKRRWRYSIEFNFMLQFHEVIRVDYRTKKIKSFHASKGYSGYDIEKIENRLGGRILKHLQKLTVEYIAFENAFRGGLLDINTDKFKLDVSEFPMDMDFDVQQFDMCSLQDGKENPTVRLLIQMMSIGAEMENNLRKERQMQGIQLAKLNNKYNGRSRGAVQSKEKTLTKYQDVTDLIKSSELSIRLISSITGRSINTVRKVKSLI